MQIPRPQGLLKSIFHAQDGILPPIMAPLQKIGFAACSVFLLPYAFYSFPTRDYITKKRQKRHGQAKPIHGV